LPLALLAAAALALPAAASEIEKPVRGKKYPLTKEHGPWMIMVASFTAPPPDVRTAGMTPAQAADELVYELRSKGMPAYTYSIGDKVEKVDTVDRLGEPDTRIYASQRGNICVLCGNYRSPEDDVAKESRDWVKAFRPKFLTGGKPDGFGMVTLDNGGVFRVTRLQPGPLSGAFFTTNPLLTPEEIRARNPEKIDLLVKLNAGGDCSLYENKGKYTLVIASFYGKSITLTGKTSTAEAAAGPSDALYQAAQDAWELARYMRQLKFEAYVWHDEHKSVVTVGSFDRKDDPRIAQAMEFYRAKIKTNAETKKEVLTAEYLSQPYKPTPKDPIRKRWIFDPQPRLMEVPKRPK
jgi:hypothetical protein